MLYREIITFSSEIHTQHVNAVCFQNVLGLNVKHGGTYSKHYALKLEHEFQPSFVKCVSQTKPMAMQYTDMCYLTTGIRSEKCVFRQVRRFANVIECTYSNLECTV